KQLHEGAPTVRTGDLHAYAVATVFVIHIGAVCHDPIQHHPADGDRTAGHLLVVTADAVRLGGGRPVEQDALVLSGGEWRSRVVEGDREDGNEIGACDTRH